MPIQSSYVGGENWRELFGALIIEERYYKKWRDLEEAIWSSYK